MYDRRRGAPTIVVVIAATAVLLVAGRLISRTLSRPTQPTVTTFSTAIGTVSPTTLPPGTQPNGQPRRVRLARGATSTEYPVQAVDPATRTVQLSIGAPAQAVMRLWLEPERGTPLAAVSTSDRTWCQLHGQQRLCSLEYESGLGPPGAWTLHLAKQSEPAVVATVTVTFPPTG